MSCVVPGCKSYAGKYSPGVTKHLIPKDPRRRQLWIDMIAREGWTPSPTAVVCSLHFDDTDYRQERNDGDPNRAKARGELKRRQLKYFAVPRYFPNCTEVSEFGNTIRQIKGQYSSYRISLDTLKLQTIGNFACHVLRTFGEIVLQ